MATIKDVAKLAGVSVGTVSRVLNNSPRISPQSHKAVHDAVKVLGYRRNAMAKALVRSHSETVGILVSDVGVPFFGAIVQGVNSVARSHDRHVLVVNGYHDAKEEREMIELLLSNGCKSIVVHAKGLSDRELERYCEEIPAMVIINRYLPNYAERCVYVNNFQGSMDACSELFANQHQKIAYVGSSEDITDAHERLRGYKAALELHGLPFSQEHVFLGDATDEGGRKATQALLRSGRSYTAIATYNDAMASGVLEILQDEGIQIPQQISVIGFDNAHIAQHLYPKLTTMNYPITSMAKTAARLALALETGESVPSDYSGQFIPTVITRRSVSSRT